MSRICLRGNTVFILACFCLAGSLTVFAKQGSATKPKSYEGLERLEFKLYPWDTLEFARRNGFKDPSTLDDRTRFLLDYKAKDWGAVAERFHEMPTDLAQRVYEKMLSDLNSGEKHPLALDDVIAIMDLCPSDLSKNSKWITLLGSLVKRSISPWESALLGARLEQGTRVAGGKNADKRLLAGRILLRAGLDDLAKTFLPAADVAAALPAESGRDEILKFLGVMQVRERALDQDAMRMTGEHVNILLDASKDGGRWDTALRELFWERLKSTPPPAVMSIVRQVLGRDSVAGQKLLQYLLHVINHEGYGSPIVADQQSGYMQMQLELADVLAASPDVPAERRKSLLTAMTENWIRQAETTLEKAPEYDKRRSEHDAKPAFVPTDVLIATAPRGTVWSQAIPAALQERVNLLATRLQICGDEPDKALGMILELARRDAQTAGLLAQDYVRRWAELRDPRIPEPVRQRYQLAPGSAMVVTPIMARKNVEGLASMMDLLRRNHIVPSDYGMIFDAFDFCYGNADVYQVADIEKVFGSVSDMPEAQFIALIRKMQENLGTRWRSTATQQTALYSRGQDQILEMIRKGYADAIRMLDTRAAKHSSEWVAPALAGTLLSDWADLECFQDLTKTPPKERTQLYKEKNIAAQEYFLKACQSYARSVPGLGANQYSAEVFTAWFNSLLGLDSNGDINLSKAMSRDALTRLRDVLRGLPGPAAERHMALFAKHIDARVADVAKPLPQELKFKYIASGQLVTADTPFGAPAGKKLDYYNELLAGVRVETRVDGPNTIWRKADFGIIVSLAHSEFMGRFLKFDKYLTGQLAPNNKGPVKRMGIDTVARNEFERSLLDALTPFFEVKSLTFSPRDVLPRKTERPGWQETVLAYAQVRAKDVSVDRIPSIDMKLDFIDVDGPVQLPVTSAETLIRLVEEKTAPRPCGDFQITQTLDVRPAISGGGMPKLTVAVGGTGLIPELDDVVDLAPLQACLPVKSTESKAGLLVKSLQSGSEKVQVTSVRQWVLTLDSAPIRAAQAAFTLRFPVPRDTNSVVRNDVFKDEDPTPVTEGQVTLPRVDSANPVGAAGADDWTGRRRFAPWAGLAAGLVLAAAVAALLVRRAGNRRPRPPRIGEVLHVPERMDAFVAVQFLRNLAASELAHYRPEQKAELAAVIRRIEQVCFDPGMALLSEEELKETSRRWLREAR